MALWAVLIIPLVAVSGDPDSSEDEAATLKDIENKEAAVADAEEARPDLASGPMEAGKDVIADWVNYMHDYESNALVSLHIAARTSQVFYEEAIVGQMLRGAYFASSGEEAVPIDFKIYSPSGNLLLQHNGPETVFHFLAKESGPFKFVMENDVYFQSKQCTFTVGVSETEKVATNKLGSAETKISKILHLANDAQAESKYLWTREANRLKHYTSVHQRVIHFAVLQFAVYACVSAFQVYYVKGLLSDRRVL